MEAGGESHTFSLAQESQPNSSSEQDSQPNSSSEHELQPDSSTVNCSAQARNLWKEDLAGVIFGCTHETIAECLSKQIFGLPIQDFSYVKNIQLGLPLFLFNYSDRKLHGIFEAASRGKMNINLCGWCSDGSNQTLYPSQVRMRMVMQYEPLSENQYKPIIKDNYTSDTQFWFELDHIQVSQLISLFQSSSASQSSVSGFPCTSSTWEDSSTSYVDEQPWEDHYSPSGNCVDEKTWDDEWSIPTECADEQTWTDQLSIPTECANEQTWEDQLSPYATCVDEKTWEDQLSTQTECANEQTWEVQLSTPMKCGDEQTWEDGLSTPMKCGDEQACEDQLSTPMKCADE